MIRNREEIPNQSHPIIRLVKLLDKVKVIMEKKKKIFMDANFFIL